MNSCVILRRAFTALIISLAALLALASCNWQPSLAKQPAAAKQKPSASLLAADIAKLGFVPGQPVTMPPDFKAERSQGLKNRIYFNFAGGGYAVDNNGALFLLLFSSPRLNNADAQAEGITKEQEDAANKADSPLEIIGPEIPYEQRSHISLLTWDQKDIFSLTEEELLKTYGPPSEPPTGLKKMTLPIREGVPEYSFFVNKVEYTFQTGDDEYWRVTFTLYKQKDGKVLVDFVGMMKFIPTDKRPLSKLKVYPWPGLYPAPAEK